VRRETKRQLDPLPPQQKKDAKFSCRGRRGSAAKFGFVVQCCNNPRIVRGLLWKRRLWRPTTGDPLSSGAKAPAFGHGVVTLAPPTCDELEMNLLWSAYRNEELLDAMECGSGMYVLRNEPRTLQLTAIPKAPAIRAHNHFDGNHVLCRKCDLRETLARYFAPRGLDPFGVMPTSFVIRTGSTDPEYEAWKVRFARIAEQRGERVWLVKPGARTNQGRGIEVFDAEEAVREMVDSKDIPWVLQKYIERPLLINGRKFDIRMFGLLLQEPEGGPFHGYIFNDGYLRTTSEPFTIENLDRRLHITNDQVQRLGNEYGRFEEGNKLSIGEFKAFLAQSRHGAGAYAKIFAQMKSIFVDVARAAKDDLNPRALDHCFELFGIDFMVDEDCRVWLLEVNTDPSLEVHGKHQEKLIPAVVEGVLGLTVDRIFSGGPVDRRPPIVQGSPSMRWLHAWCSADDDAVAAEGGTVDVECSWVERIPDAEAAELLRGSVAATPAAQPKLPPLRREAAGLDASPCS